MSSELKQRKPQPAAEDVPDKDEKDKSPVEPAEDVAPTSTSSSGVSIHRRAVSWLLSHPEITFSIITSLVCIIMLWVLTRPRVGPVLFDRESLKLYNGQKNSPLYLAILGEVYDVTQGRRHYDAGKGYGGFVGRDASRAFITGDFSGDLNDDIEDFTPEQLKALVEWRDFYRQHKVYKYVGKLVGRFYNKAGGATRFLRKVEEQAAVAKSEEELQREMEAQWPACSVRWTEAEGGSVWCNEDAYPRKVFTQLPGGKPTTRCACFQEIGWSDIRQVYPDCAPDAHKCKV